LSGKRDFQRSRVYAWENRAVAPHDPTFVQFAAAQGMVDAIWTDMGLHFPPKVEPLAPQARATVASANRLSIFLGEQTQSWCLLHEIAHAMTSTADGHSDGHGANFVGIYFQLIVRYLRRSPDELHDSLKSAGIEFSIDAQPSFVESRG
jgi:hypothetical protein